MVVAQPEVAGAAAASVQRSVVLAVIAARIRPTPDAVWIRIGASPEAVVIPTAQGEHGAVPKARVHM